MTIKLNTPGVVQIEGDSGSAIVEFKNGKVKDAGDSIHITARDAEGSISGPGEYEHAGVEVAMLETKQPADGFADMAQVRVENVNVLSVIQTPGELQKDQWELIDNVHILCLDATVEMEEPSKFVNKINPYVLIIVNADKETAEKWTGMTIESQDKKFKFSEKDFTAEEPVLRVLLLA